VPSNISLGWKWLTMTNALAYCGKELMTVEKSFTKHAPGFNGIKPFFFDIDPAPE